MLTKRYNLINNIGGWFVFLIALVTYWCTLEPTASYWDCGEFIIQADKLEVGHPPGNPIFMLTARFFANFAPDAAHIALMVNAMSGLLSALTILLLFWTITHLVRRLVVREGQRKEISWQQYLAIMGSGLVGSLAYCWSDTFWFSAVEGEVYAFSSFCTALVFWLILKWEDHADRPGSDRYLILIAYIIGVSIAVHLLNLLCITAIVLVFVYHKYKNVNVVKSLIAILVSFVIIALVLYGLVPGFIKVAQRFELLFVNSFGCGFNSGALAYAIVMAASFVWAIYELRAQKSANRIRLSFFIAVLLSGMLWIGEGWVLGLVLTLLLAATLWGWFHRGLPVRVLNVILWSMGVIFVGYSSYALILIRSTADTPMNQNSPDNVFDLASYLNREQYGAYPLIYGETVYSRPQHIYEGSESRMSGANEVRLPVYSTNEKVGSKVSYAKGVKGAQPTGLNLTDAELRHNEVLAAGHKDFYVKKERENKTIYNPELNMWFPRIYSSLHAQAYEEWFDPSDYEIVGISAISAEDGSKVPEYDVQGGDFAPMTDLDGNEYFVPSTPLRAKKPSISQNLAYFFNYQLNHMYMRYFMWNFAGRQNDILNQHGEYDVGNWISGYGFIDNPRLGDQSLLPDELGEENPGHNVYYMLPLILGLLGLLWQAFAGRRGIEQFWVIFFLFFMTGIAIVFYLNQPPGQPRERDYAFAGSFYAFAIWIGMGVAALWRIILYFMATRKWLKAEGVKNQASETDEPLQVESVVDEPKALHKKSLVAACIACAFGLIVPLQMVSQTWDDHDRSGRFAARDYAINYLESLEPNAIIFCNGDNDTFPLWYAQEVEGVRPDVRIINLSYLNSDWYANQQRMQAYEAEPVPMTALPVQYAYDRLNYAYIMPDTVARPMIEVLKKAYESKDPILTSPAYIPVDSAVVVKRGLVDPEDMNRILPRMEFDLEAIAESKGMPVLTLNEMLLLDIVATNAAEGWKRPIYIANTVGEEFHAGITPYLKQVGMAQQVVPVYQQDLAIRTEQAYKVITEKFRWGGADNKERKPYFDETANRMFYSMKSTVMQTVAQFITLGDDIAENDPAKAKECYQKALNLLNLIDEHLPESMQKLNSYTGPLMADAYLNLSDPSRLDDKKLKDRALKIWNDVLVRGAKYVAYNQMLNRQFGPNASRYYQTLAYFYYYTALYKEYKDLGGDTKNIDEALKRYGLSYDKLVEAENLARQREEEALRAQQEDGQDDDQDVIGTLVSYAMQANRTVKSLQDLSPEEYAGLDDESKELDSMFYGFIEYLHEQGADEVLKQHPEIVQGVDTARSHRLWNSYSNK